MEEEGWSGVCERFGLWGKGKRRVLDLGELLRLRLLRRIGTLRTLHPIRLGLASLNKWNWLNSMLSAAVRW